MTIPPKYNLTPKIAELLQSIEASRAVIDSVSIPPEIELNIRRQSTLKSSLYSARIEGNPLTEDDLSTTSSQDQRKQEVFNILKALNWLQGRSVKDLTNNDLMKLHSKICDGLVEPNNLGKIRREVSAIFNSAGIAIYMPPPPRQIQPGLEKLLKFINSSREQFIPIRAALAHYTFEKIHPFLDGNGRVGRLLIQAVLHKGGYGMKGLVAIEPYLDSNRSWYYQGLEDLEKDVTDYLEFMLKAIATSAETAKEIVLKKKNIEAEDYLLPRRAEILRIIKDQKLINFDTLKRRFLNVNERTLRFDLKRLSDEGLIRKLGSTRGVYYEPI